MPDMGGLKGCDAVFQQENPRKHSVIYSWVLSYGVMILIPVLVIAVVYGITRGIIADEINHSNYLAVKNAGDTMDNIFQDMERLGIEVASNQTILKVLDMERLGDPSPSYTLFNAARELNSYRIFNGSKNHLFLYYRHADTVISMKNAYSASDFYTLYMQTPRLPEEDWKTLISSSHVQDFLILPYHEQGQEESSTIAFVRTVPITGHGDSMANLFILLNFDDLLRGGEDSRSIRLIDETGQVVAGQKGVRLTPEDYQRMTGKYGRVEMTGEDGGKVVVSYMSSGVNGWKYITVTPVSIFWQKVKFIVQVMLAGIAVCVLLGGLLATFFLRRNYHPLREMVAHFRLKTAGGMQDGNEYHMIRGAFEETLLQKERISQQLQLQHGSLRASGLSALLRGKTQQVPFHEFLSAYDIRFRYNRFVVIAIFIDHLDEDAWLRDYGQGVDVLGITRFIISNVTEELLNRRADAVVAETGDMLACIVSLPPEAPGAAYFQEILEEATAFLENTYQIGVSFAAGDRHEGAEGIGISCAEALRAMEYAKVMGLNRLVVFEELAAVTGGTYDYPVEKEYQLINCIKAADTPGALAILDDIIRRNTVHRSPSPETVRCLMFDIIGTLLKALNEMEQQTPGILAETIDPMGELMRCRNLQEVRARVMEILEAACGGMEKSPAVPNYKIRDQIQELVQAGYSDPNLGLASIADQLGKNSHYISRIFREQTGESIVDYINKVRIRRARELMKESDANMEDIAARVGYANIRTFQRVFKKQEGTSPGKARG